MDNFKKYQGRRFTELGAWLNIKCEKWKKARKTCTLQIEKSIQNFVPFSELRIIREAGLGWQGCILYKI